MNKVNNPSHDFHSEFSPRFERSLADHYKASFESRFVSHTKRESASEDAFYDFLYGGSSASKSAPASPSGAQLDKRDDTLTPRGVEGDKKPDFSGIKDSKQVSRWRLKHTVCNILRSKDSEKTPSVCKCGTAGFETTEITLTRNNNGAGVRGVFYCDSPWLCPSCAPRRAAERAEKVQKVFEATERKGGQITFVTLTVQHGKKDNLAGLKHIVNEAGRKAREGKPWKLAQDRYNIVGSLVSPEVTYSLKNGWHYHLHLALVVLTNDEEKAEEAGEWLIERYMNYVAKLGGKTSRKAQDVTVVWREEDLAKYMAKGSAAWEVASAGATKTAASGSLSPWDLAALAGKGDEKSASLFLEYSAVMPGTKACVITKKIAAALDIKPEDDEDTEGVEQIEDEAEIVGVMPPSRWHKILRNGYAADVLKVTGAGWKWSDIDNLIARMLKEESGGSDYSYQQDSKIKEHRLSESQFIDKVRREFYRLSGKTKTVGRAVQIALDAERAYAVKNNKIFISPNLKSVIEFFAADQNLG